MGKPVIVRVEKYGDGFKPMHGMCPLKREHPEDDGPAWCENSQCTSACEHMRGSVPSMRYSWVVCVYHMTPEEQTAAEAKRGSCVAAWEAEPQGEPYKDMHCMCGSTHFVQARSGPHMGVYCGECAKWLEWLPQVKTYDPGFIWPIGEKHKGTKISLVPTDYLLWGSENLKGGLQTRCQQALHHRGFMFLTYLWDAFQEVRRTHPDAVGLPAMNGMEVPIAEVQSTFITKHPKTTETAFAMWFSRVTDLNARTDYPSFTVTAHGYVMAMWYKPSKTEMGD